MIRTLGTIAILLAGFRCVWCCCFFCCSADLQRWCCFSSEWCNYQSQTGINLETIVKINEIFFMARRLQWRKCFRLNFTFSSWNSSEWSAGTDLNKTISSVHYQLRWFFLCVVQFAQSHQRWWMPSTSTCATWKSSCYERRKKKTQNTKRFTTLEWWVWNFNKKLGFFIRRPN